MEESRKGEREREKKRERRDGINSLLLSLYCPPFSAGPFVYIASVKVSGHTLQITCKDI